MNDTYRPDHPDWLDDVIGDWPGTHALAVADERALLGAAGDLDRVFAIASISKLFTTYACLIAVEEGTLDLDRPAGPPGATVRHLLAHASGLAFDSDTIHASAGTRRVYSNTGIDVAAETLADAAGMDFADYLRLGVLEPLGLGHVDATASPAHGLHMTVRDLITFGHELLTPTLVSAMTVTMAITPQFPELSGVLPGFGSHHANTWGLGFEIKGDKDPHWTAPAHGPATFGHFGGAGSFLWIDPVRRLIAATAGDTAFGPWAVDAWPMANATLVERYGPA